MHQSFAERQPEKDQRDGVGAFVTRGSVDATAEKEIRGSGLEAGVETADGEEPSEYEKEHLRRVGENLPASAFLIAIVELCERFTFYGAQGIFQNYINNKPNGDDGARGLGLGHQGATGLNLFFQWFCYGMHYCFIVLVLASY